jgi:LuxR family transcriptional regulator, regulator of acetate metabolism
MECPLTPRELDVLEALSHDGASAAAAARLGVSPNTVKTLRFRLLRKMGVHRMAVAVAIALREGWIE